MESKHAIQCIYYRMGRVSLPLAGNNLRVDNCFVVISDGIEYQCGMVDDYIDLNIGKIRSNKMD